MGWEATNPPARVIATASGFGHDPRPVRFVDDADAELLGFLELGAGAGAGDHEIRLRADRTRGPRAEPLRLRLGFVAAHGLEAAGEDDRLAAPFGLFRVADEGLRRYLRKEVVE